MDKIIYKEESYKIIGACLEVHKELGNGFLEAVYQEALEIEFINQGIPFEREKPLSINFKGHILKKKYTPDFVCYGKIIVELKALTELRTEDISQVLNYLKVSEYKLGLLVNFGESSLNYERFVK